MIVWIFSSSDKLPYIFFLDNKDIGRGHWSCFCWKETTFLQIWLYSLIIHSSTELGFLHFWLHFIHLVISSPFQLCVLLGGQATMKKLDEQQTRAMVRAAATNTDDRKRKIREAVSCFSFFLSICFTAQLLVLIIFFYFFLSKDSKGVVFGHQ